MITLEVGGKFYSNWKSVSVERALDQISGIFRFEAAADWSQPFPVPRGEACRVRINGKIVMTGYVDNITIDYDANSHAISIEGRDKTGDIVDSMLDGKMEFKAPVTMEEVIRKTLDNIGATDVKVINQVKDLKPFSKDELVSGKIGMRAFEFMDKYAAKRQVILTTDGEGNVVIARASEELTNIFIKNVISDPFNSIKKARVAYTDGDRYNEYKFFAQANHAADPDNDEDKSKSTNRTATATDDDIRPSRKFRAIAEGSQKEKPLEERAKWEANIREAKSFKYSVLMTGHSPYSHDGEPYQPNTLVKVKDDFSDIDTELLIVKVTHKLDLNDGSTTELEMLTRTAFLLLLQEKYEKGDDKKKKGGADESKYSNYDNDYKSFYSKDYEKAK